MSVLALIIEEGGYSTGAPQNSKIGQVFAFFVVFRPTGATVCTDEAEIWHGRAHHVHSCVPDLSLIS